MSRDQLPEVLLVEDDPADVRLIRRALERSDVPVNLAAVEDGEQALAHLRQEGEFRDAERPDLILLDLNMPKKDGAAFLEELRADRELAAIPVIVLTTSRAAEDVRRSYDLGANAYITKPSSVREFAMIVETLEKFWFTVAILPPHD